ncbi:pyridoxal phosphate-dependent aminotransferase [Salinispora pacifica]|uniref:pyridoxal phosphate-dependent aminotransferase n=1 Tax=Salinispora pacifica TaxID=351187 RepID=UPI00047FA5F4|nr:pyridoxal phosphate-dependent aminotransferase [Salinispora pacifica]
MTSARTRRSLISRRAAELRGNTLTELFVLARARRAVDLAVGTPECPETPQALIAEATSALRAGHNQYELPAGEASLRRWIAELLGLCTDPETEVTVTAGATEGLHVALLATIDPGDEVVLLTPGYEQLVAAVRLAGGIPRFVSLHPPDWRYDPDDLAAAFSERTRAVLLNTPSNPTGQMLGRPELDEIAMLCERWDATVISDEVYRDLVFDGRRHVSVAEVPGLAERSIVVGSLSKSYAVSGWRLGFVRADGERTRAVRRVHELATNGTAAPLQVAAGRARLSTDLSAVALEVRQRRDLAQQIFADLGMSFAPAAGGCFLLADISALTGGRQDCFGYVRELLDRAGVLLVPGAPFFNVSDGSDPSARGEQYVRIAFNRRTETLLEAERRMRGA